VGTHKLVTEEVVEDIVMENDITRIEERIKSMDISIKEIRKHLLGNGREGIIDRQARSETHIESLLKVTENNIKTVQELERSTRSLKSSVSLQNNKLENHIDSPEMHSVRVILNKEFLVAMVVLFLVISVLVEAGSPLLKLIFSYLGLSY
jgi:hypothetical protein